MMLMMKMFTTNGFACNQSAVVYFVASAVCILHSHGYTQCYCIALRIVTLEKAQIRQSARGGVSHNESLQGTEYLRTKSPSNFLHFLNQCFEKD